MISFPNTNQGDGIPQSGELIVSRTRQNRRWVSVALLFGCQWWSARARLATEGEACCCHPRTLSSTAHCLIVRQVQR